MGNAQSGDPEVDRQQNERITRIETKLRSVETAQAAVADAVGNDDDEVQGECYVHQFYKKWSDGSNPHISQYRPLDASQTALATNLAPVAYHDDWAQTKPVCTPADVCEYIWQDGRHAYCSMTEGIEGAVDPSQYVCRLTDCRL